MPVSELKLFPNNPPAGWRLLTHCRDGAAYVRNDELIVISNVVRELNGNRWLHISCSREGQQPSMQDLQAVRGVFAPSHLVFQVLPKVNKAPLGPRCLHLWASLEDLEFPGFLKAW